MSSNFPKSVILNYWQEHKDFVGHLVDKPSACGLATRQTDRQQSATEYQVLENKCCQTDGFETLGRG